MRYHQIVETQSFNQLTGEEQRIFSEDRKHSSAVAKVHFRKQWSSEVALKGHECLQKLQGAKGSEVDEDVHARLVDSTSEAGPSVERVQNISSSLKKDALPKKNLALALEHLSRCEIYKWRGWFSKEGKKLSPGLDTGLLFWEMTISNFKTEEQRTH